MSATKRGVRFVEIVPIRWIERNIAIKTQDPKEASDFPKLEIQMDDWLLFFRVDGASILDDVAWGCDSPNEQSPPRGRCIMQH